MRFVTLSGDVREVDASNLPRRVHHHIIVGGEPTVSVLSLLTAPERRELHQWATSQPAARGIVKLDAVDLAGALPESINLGLWPGWPAVALRLQVDSANAWAAVNDLLARLQK